MECVLMQAWKKTSSYLRSQSWYADTLRIDMQSLRVSSFLGEIQARLQKADQWEPRPLRFVPAPKNQRWEIDENGRWGPERPKKKRSKSELSKQKDQKKKDYIRPLAHVDLEDQVVATAILLCLADRVESRLGDPRLDVKKGNHRKEILAYGHRLYCDKAGESSLRHRWGSSKLYRGYFEDYKKFLERPRRVENELKSRKNRDLDIAVVQSDLSKFYDRVRPSMLHEKLRELQNSSDETPFFDLAERVLNWRWHTSDQNKVKRYADANDIDGEFQEVALPQGLVASGFFANIALIDFEKELKTRIGNVFGTDELNLEDICYYVDDFRLTLSFSKDLSIEEVNIEELVIRTLKDLLSSCAPGLELSCEKTSAAIETRDNRLYVKQSREATRIQKRASGIFDATLGTELIGAIESFFYRQQHYATSEIGEFEETMAGVPDMPDETVARFAAGRMRRTFRSLRPLLPDEEIPEYIEDQDTTESVPNFALTKSQLDERGKAFSSLLIGEWIRNPGHVRLLRIALDIYPSHQFLDRVLQLLRESWESTGTRGSRRQIMLYCLAELFRAGATETGMVLDVERDSLPSEVSIKNYHESLAREGKAIVSAYITKSRSGARFPWYLMQQVFLYLATRNQIPETVLITDTRKGGDLLGDYWKLLKFLRGRVPDDLEKRSIFLVETITAFGITEPEKLLSTKRISRNFLLRVNSISPIVAKKLWTTASYGTGRDVKQLAIRLGLEPSGNNGQSIIPLDGESPKKQTLSDLTPAAVNPFHEEENLLLLAEYLLSQDSTVFAEPIVPAGIRFSLKHPRPKGFELGKLEIDSIELKSIKDDTSPFFISPDWCEDTEDRQRFNTGLLLRYALRGSTDFLSNRSKSRSRSYPRYTKPVSHWEQQRYAGYQGRDAFGPDWLPISQFTENRLFDLLRWPGAGVGYDIAPVHELLGKVSSQLEHIRKKRGQYTSTTFLEQSAPLPHRPQEDRRDRDLRIGIVQSVVPSFEHYIKHRNDPELCADEIRSKCREHLSAIMAGVVQQLRVRESHICSHNKRSLDLLVFPELAIHPQDIDTYLLPFVQQYRCIVLLGQVYHPKDLHPDSPIVNSALWIIPDKSSSDGLQIKRIEQGKAYIAKAERNLSPAPIGFRPAQWLINYHWQKEAEEEHPLRLTASICYDATDLALAADLSTRSDLYVICALNKDVGTFDRMAEAIHYHMFQGVIVVNNGQFGGSSFFMPFKKPYEREVFHLHGQPQASIAFAEIDPLKLIKRPSQDFRDKPPKGKWKTPPAGLYGCERPGSSSYDLCEGEQNGEICTNRPRPTQTGDACRRQEDKTGDS